MSSTLRSDAGARVLVAEDDTEMRQLVSELLRGAGYDVTAVATGSEMLALIAQQSVARFPEDAFDLIVTDIRMPGCTGFEAVGRLRSLGYATPVIAITAFPDETMHRQARKLAALIVAKPFALSELESVVASSLHDRALGERGGR